MRILTVKPAKWICLIPALLVLAAGPVWSLSGESSEVARCKGHGVVNFQGDGTVYMSGDGVLVVNEGVDVIFDTEVSEDDDRAGLTEDPECFPYEDGGCAYILINGRAWISGEGRQQDIAVL